MDRLKALQPLLDGGLLHRHVAVRMPGRATQLLVACRYESSLDSCLEVLARPWQT